MSLTLPSSMPFLSPPLPPPPSMVAMSCSPLLRCSCLVVLCVVGRAVCECVGVGAVGASRGPPGQAEVRSCCLASVRIWSAACSATRSLGQVRAYWPFHLDSNFFWSSPHQQVLSWPIRSSISLRLLDLRAARPARRPGRARRALHGEFRHRHSLLVGASVSSSVALRCDQPMGGAVGGSMGSTPSQTPAVPPAALAPPSGGEAARPRRAVPPPLARGWLRHLEKFWVPASDQEATALEELVPAHAAVVRRKAAASSPLGCSDRPEREDFEGDPECRSWS